MLFSATALALGSCGKNNLAATRPELLVTPSSLDFGPSPQNFPVAKNLALEDGGEAILTFGTVSIDGPQAAMFTLGATVPAQLTPRASFALPVSFYADRCRRGLGDAAHREQRSDHANFRCATLGLRRQHRRARGGAGLARIWPGR